MVPSTHGRKKFQTQCRKPRKCWNVQKMYTWSSYVKLFLAIGHRKAKSSKHLADKGFNNQIIPYNRYIN